MKELNKIVLQKGLFCFNKRAPLFDKGALGQSIKAGGG